MNNALLAGLSVMLLGGVILAGEPEPLADVSAIAAAEDAYYTKTGEYVQVKPGNLLPEYKEGDVKTLLGKDVAPEYRVSVYETPKGERGYQVLWSDATNNYSQGYGPEADLRTHTTAIELDPPFVSSTTTEARAPFRSLFTWLFPIAHAFSTNSHSTDLEAGSSQYWSIADASQTGLDITGDLTISFWVNFESVPSGGSEMDIITKWYTTTDNRSYRIRYNDDGGTLNLYAQVDETGAGTDQTTYTYTNTFSTATWYMITAVYTAATPKWDIYVNGSGVSESAVDTTATAILSGAASYAAGTVNADGTPVNFFDGKLEDVIIANSAFSAGTVSSLYADPCNFTDASIVSRWLYDNDGNDSVGSNNLTNNNVATFSTDVAYTCPSTTGGGDIIIFD